MIVKEQTTEAERVIERLRETCPDIPDSDLCLITGLVVEQPTVQLGIGFNLQMAQYGCVTSGDFIITEDDKPVENYNTISKNCPLAKAVLGRDKGYTTTYTVGDVDTTIRIAEIYEKQKVKTITQQKTNY